MPTPLKENKLLILCFLLFLGSGSGKSTKPGPNQEIMASCDPKTCGNGPNVSFPFWIDGIHPPFCGIRLSRLTCDKAGSGYPVISISEDDYIVHNISYDRRLFELKRKFPPQNSSSSCDGFPNRSFTLDNAPYAVSPDSNASLIFLFGCNNTTTLTRLRSPGYGLGTEIARWFPLPCQTQKPGTASFVVYSLSRQPLDQDALQETACYSPAVIFPITPFPHTFGDSDPGAFPTSYEQLLDFRITLNWTTINCTKCIDSGGRCGTRYQASSFEIFCICPDGNHTISCDGQYANQNKWKWKVIGSTVTGVGFVMGLLFLFTCCPRRSVVRKRIDYLPSLTQLFKKNLDESRAIEVFLEEYKSLELKRYTYSELKKMTKSFSEELGHGGYGKVFKGKLKDGQIVAVKLLNESKGSGQEFINEVTSIGRTNHMNIVRLLGFCSEGLKKALLYEFMPNGSLEKFLSNDISNVTKLIQWEDLYKIVIGVARGLEYLHKGCTTRVVHFDIKPHNILLDEDFNPKISDFGLAKLCPSKASILSMNVPRGTIGYIAPEVFSRNFGVVSSKSDVYSYGMMVLEMIGLRNHRYVKMQSSDTSAYFPQWVYEKFDENGNLDTYGITKDEHAHELVKKMILVGLWCIQTNPIERPSISKVVEMLDGNSKDLEMPPKPYICSPTMSIEEIESIPMI